MIFQNAELYNVEELLEDQERSGYRILRLPQSVIGQTDILFLYMY